MKDSEGALVSIVLPTFKRENLIVNAIENIKSQTYKNLEIIVINDNGKENIVSRDLTYKNLKNYIKNEEIKYIELENNLGGARARNEGIKASKGEYISFYDDDDEYYPNKIELQVKKFEENKQKLNLAFVKCELDYKYKDLIVEKSKTKIFFETDCLLKEHIKNLHGIVGTTTFLFKTSILKKIKGFENVPIRQEYTLVLKILNLGYTGIHMDENLVSLNCEGESITRTKNESKVEYMEELLMKRMGYPGLSSKEKQDIQKDHYLDLAEWYCSYKKIKSIKYSLKAFRFNKMIILKLIKLNLKNLFERYYILLRKEIKGF